MNMREKLDPIALAEKCGAEKPSGVYPGAWLFYPDKLHAFADAIIAALQEGQEPVAKTNVLDGCTQAKWLKKLPDGLHNLYAIPPDASARIADLEAAKLITDGMLVSRGEEIAALREQVKTLERECADVCTAMDGAHELSGPIADRVCTLINQRQELRASLTRAQEDLRLSTINSLDKDGFIDELKEQLSAARSECERLRKDAYTEVVNSVPFVRATIDRASGLHELWLMQNLPNGKTTILAGPRSWPDGWIEMRANRLMDAQTWTIAHASSQYNLSGEG